MTHVLFFDHLGITWALPEYRNRQNNDGIRTVMKLRCVTHLAVTTIVVIFWLFSSRNNTTMTIRSIETMRSIETVLAFNFWIMIANNSVSSQWAMWSEMYLDSQEALIKFRWPTRLSWTASEGSSFHCAIHCLCWIFGYHYQHTNTILLCYLIVFKMF